MPEDRLLLYVTGPVEIGFDAHPSGQGKKISPDHVTAFWKHDNAARIASKHGCYVFAVKAAKGYKPWYVGKASRPLKREAFGPYQLGQYNDVLFTNKKGTPVMFFVAPSGTKNKVPMKSVDEMETFLIQSAYLRNPEVRNRKKTKPPAWGIKSVIRSNAGKPHVAAGAFTTMMRIS